MEQAGGTNRSSISWCEKVKRWGTSRTCVWLPQWASGWTRKREVGKDMQTAVDTVKGLGVRVASAELCLGYIYF